MTSIGRKWAKKEQSGETLEMLKQLESTRVSSKKKKILAYTRTFVIDWIQDKFSKLVPKLLEMETGKISPFF